MFRPYQFWPHLVRRFDRFWIDFYPFGLLTEATSLPLPLLVVLRFSLACGSWFLVLKISSAGSHVVGKGGCVLPFPRTKGFDLGLSSALAPGGNNSGDIFVLVRFNLF
jgi:hypothetical protein